MIYTLYTAPECAECHTIKAALEAAGHDVEEIDAQDFFDTADKRDPLTIDLIVQRSMQNEALPLIRQGAQVIPLEDIRGRMNV